MPKINNLQLNNINSIQHIREITRSLNLAIQEINKLNNLDVKGPSGTFINKTANGININIPKAAAQTDIFVAEIDSDATGGGYYNCYIQKLDAGNDWNVNDKDVFDDKDDDTVVVLNLVEHNSDTHDLEQDDMIFCWKIKDKASANSQGTVYVGIPIAAAEGIKKANVVSISDTYYTLNSGSGDDFNVYTFSQGQSDWDLTTNVIPRFKVGNSLPYYSIGSTKYIAQTFIYVGNNRSVRWVEEDGLTDDPNRAGAFFRDL